MLESDDIDVSKCYLLGDDMTDTASVNAAVKSAMQLCGLTPLPFLGNMAQQGDGY